MRRLLAAIVLVLPAPAAHAAGGAGQIRGTIAYGRHTPAIGAVVLVHPQDAGTPVYAATTGVSGTFAFGGLADGTYVAEIRREGFVPVVKRGIVVRAPFRAVVEVLLLPGESPSPAAAAGSGTASLTGRVRGAGGVVLAEGHVKIVRSDGGDDPRAAQTDGTGGFAFTGLTGGQWRVELSGAGLLPLRASLDLSGDVTLEASLAPQPPDYLPPAQDLIIPEDVTPPPAP